MKIIEALNQINKTSWFFLILIVAALFYLHNINFSDIWIDESFTKALVAHSFRDMLGLIRNDFHPPLYFYALKIFVTFFGLSTFTLRLFSVIGVLSTIAMGYIAGQRIFGKSGALHFCLLIFSLPMLASYSHDARMYTWGAFSVTGLWLYAVLFVSNGKRSDLILLMFFSLLAAYTHYYGLIAAFWANVYVVVLLFARKDRNRRIHLGSAMGTVLCYLPWAVALLYHTRKAQEFFWVPPVTWQTILSCFTTPFAEKFRMTSWSWFMMVVIYGLSVWIIYHHFMARQDKHKVVLRLSLFIFGFTVLTTTVISLFSQPVLYSRYIMIIVTMLMVPPALFFATAMNKWVKGIVIALILCCGIVISSGSSRFSFGPYKQSVVHIRKTYPGIKKVFHVMEITAGPFAEYSRGEFDNYFFNPEGTIVFTNMDVFTNLYFSASLDKVLEKDESFCVVSFPGLPFNEKNLQLIISESQLMKVDTVADNKVESGNLILLYLLTFNGTKLN